MIRHIVLFSARDPDDLATIESTLWTLADIPSVRGFEVGVNRRYDAVSSEFDLVVHAVFDDESALEAYKQHPIYRRSVEVVRPLRDLRIAVDYEVADVDPDTSTGARRPAPPSPAGA